LRLANTLCGVLAQKLLPTVDKRRRVCAIEVMINTPTISKLIEEGRSGNVPGAINEGEYWGMQSMNKSIMGHYLNGMVTEQTSIQYAGNATEMRQMIRRLSQANVKTTSSTL
jgi:Tfp pilus assembly pilus retraction ATPase PilT